MISSIWSALFGGMFGKKRKTPGLFTEGGVTYGEEALKLPREERVALAPEEITRRREAFKPERSKRVAKRRDTLLAGAPKVKTGGFFLGA